MAWERLRRKSGIKDLRFHDLRREALSRLTEKGLSPIEVAEISGHKQLGQLRNYIHLNNFKRVNNNIKFLFRNNSKQFNDLNTKLDLLNTKINTLNKELINNTHKMCVKIQSLENLIKNNEIKKVKK